MSELNAADVLQLLRKVNCPGFDGDVVALGFVKNIEVAGNDVTIKFAPNTRNQEKVDGMERDIQSVIAADGDFENIAIDRVEPFAEEGNGGLRRPTPLENPLQAELHEEGLPVEPDILQESMRRADIAREAGYGEDGPTPLQGPELETYDGPVPVLQWEIDPADTSAEGGEDSVVIGGWDIGVWWQVHPAGVVYVSMQAIHEDDKDNDGAARSHPVGRSEAVNLVYDGEREVVVAIYGTVPDFRPFVEAFRLAYIEGPTSR